MESGSGPEQNFTKFLEVDTDYKSSTEKEQIMKQSEELIISKPVLKVTSKIDNRFLSNLNYTTISQIINEQMDNRETKNRPDHIFNNE